MDPRRPRRHSGPTNSHRLRLVIPRGLQRLPIILIKASQPNRIPRLQVSPSSLPSLSLDILKGQTTNGPNKIILLLSPTRRLPAIQEHKAMPRPIVTKAIHNLLQQMLTIKLMAKAKTGSRQTVNRRTRLHLTELHPTL